MTSFDRLSSAEKLERYERLARKALTAYGLEEADLRYLGESTNVMFRVQTDTSRWALRICSPGRDHKLLMRELLWLVSLCRDTDLGVPEPVIMRSGDLFRSVSMPGLSGFRACMLFRWVNGQFEEDLTVEHLKAMGTLTAKLHKQAETFRWPEEIEPVRVSQDAVAGSIAGEVVKAHCSRDEVELLRNTIPLIQQAMLSLGTGSDVCGVIHGDLHPGNILFHEGVARAIDFECIQWNHYAYDLATVLGALAGRSDIDKLREAYTSGYLDIRHLPCDLDEHLPAFEMMSAFALMERSRATSSLKGNGNFLSALAAAVRKAKRILKAQ